MAIKITDSKGNSIQVAAGGVTASSGLPSGGLEDYTLVKKSAEDGDAEWKLPAGIRTEGKTVIDSGEEETCGDGAEVFNITGDSSTDPIAIGAQSHAEGRGSIARGAASHAEGSSIAQGIYAHAEGEQTSAIGNSSHTEGLLTLAQGEASHAEGSSIIVNGEKFLNTASGVASHVEGIGTTASGSASHAQGRLTTASGTGAHAEGHSTIASGDQSHAEGYKTIASEEYSHTEGFQSQAIEMSAHAEGYQSQASGIGAHAEGGLWFLNGEAITAKGPIASGNSSHAEGSSTIASGNSSHAEGNLTKASGNYSHAEGSGTTASGEFSHAEGINTIASGAYSHAEGDTTTASGVSSYASGTATIASIQNQRVIGKYNMENTSQTSALFIIGKGNTESSRANCFRVGQTGVWATGNYNTSGADYAEMFEWEDGNPLNEDRCGRFVTLNGTKISLAWSDDEILGIVSGSPSVVGDVNDDQWQGMFITDIFGRPIWEDVEVSDEIIQVSNPETGETVNKVIIPAHTERRQKLNSDYNPDQKYIPRSERPEWDAVGMLGKLVVVDDGTCEVNGYCSASKNGIATSSEIKTRFRVMERLDEDHIRVLVL